jgi:hypothetical protein
MTSFIQALEEDADEAIMCNAVATCIDPPNYNVAMKTATADRWNIAIEDELKSLRDNRTWVVDKTPDVKPLASRFVFKLKRDSDGAVERYKARLVARCSQSNVDMCLYYRTTKTAIILVGIYVDDLLVKSNNVKLIDEFFEQMKTFDVKDLGEAEKFLRIKS